MDRGVSRLKTVRAGTRGIAGCGLGVAAVLLIAIHVAAPDGVLGEVTYLSVLLGAGVVSVCGAWRRPAETRAAWCWIASGICLSALGDLTYSTYVQARGFEPDVSGADVPWLASYVAISI